jgi:CheY-like chemotaxis protein
VATGSANHPPDGRPLVLVVDDDQPVAYALRDSLEPEFRVVTVGEPRGALERLGEMEVAVVLADQQMPGMGGVELIAEAHRRHPDVVGVLITAYANLDTALQAINAARAFAFLTKPWDLDELLVVVRRAVDAHHALQRQRGALLDGLRERELLQLGAMAHAHPAPVTAQRFGSGPLCEREPGVFEDLLRQYAEALEHAFAQRIYRVNHHVSATLVSLADRLGALRAGPRDVMELHTTALSRRLQVARIEEADAYAEEGRLLVLELMGHLVSVYRANTLGIPA